MAAIVEEMMNRELFSLRVDESSEAAIGYLVALGVSAAPVLDEDRRPIGVVSLRDLLVHKPPAVVGEGMTRPALGISEKASLEHAARLAVESGVHHLVVLDAEGRAVGFISALDLLRGLIGLPAAHPPTFPHYDAQSGVAFTDDIPFDLERVQLAPDGPGVFCLIEGGRDRREVPSWAEASHNVRARLYDLLSPSQSEDSRLLQLLHNLPRLRFRAAAVPDSAQRAGLAQRLMADVTRPLRPAPGALG
jgi:CBS domain-containing protein